MQPLRRGTIVPLAFLLFQVLLLRAADPALQPSSKDQDSAGKPIRALLITGGCCHDYDRQKLILPQGISARANVQWTIVQQGGKTTDTRLPVYEDRDWADGFDVVVHNECFSHVTDPAWVERILKPHREGLPAVLIHCAMHSYRVGTDQWFEFVGLQSPGHGPHYAYTVENLAAEHPIMRDFGPRWTVPKGELYHSVRVFPTATPLAHARRQEDNQPQVCVWTNQYGQGRVFATTIGHYNETMAEPRYLDMVTRGLLWAVNRLQDGEFRPADEATNARIQSLLAAPIESAQPAIAQCCGAGNLAFGKPATASSEETGKQNLASKANDGNLRSRWCASGGQTGSWWQVDLGAQQRVASLRIHWEKDNVAYRYKAEASVDGQAWRTIVDQSANTQAARVTPHEFQPLDARHLRVTFLGSSTGVWGSFWEFEAYADKLPPLPEGVSGGDAGSAASIVDVTAPAGFDVTLFGTPPQVNYPVCLAAAPTGELFVGVDEQGSLGKQPGRGKVLRCRDLDGDGRADQINVFATMDHPRGLIYDQGSLWVLHPPLLSVYHDDDLDGVADRSQVLVQGLSTDFVEKRGADHTTNGIRLGIDGWIYIAVGDFGFTRAEDAAGNVLSRRGGGVVRVRPDGTELEIYAWGLRNILDVCIDLYMNIFTRDNTNDGGGWNVRLSHVIQTAQYGYPSLYMNFADEIMPPLADYGGGSGCGGMYFHDTRWPRPFGDAVYTCDWGRSEVYRHNLPAAGPTFDAHQELFLKIPRPTDIDCDGSGRMYVASWKNGNFDYTGPDVGFVAQITPRDFLPKPFPDLRAAADQQLVAWHASPSAVYRLHSQRELLRRGRDPARSRLLAGVAADGSAPLHGRVAAIFTLAQLDERDAHNTLLELAADESVREFALRALTDRRGQLDELPLEPFLTALGDNNPRVRAQALISLGRLGRVEAAQRILPLTVRSTPPTIDGDVPAHAQPDAGRVEPHLAVQALVDLRAVDACLAALSGPYRDGALRALSQMHEQPAVEGLVRQLGTTREQAARRQLFSTLIRLYHREGPYTSGWWGTRPDTSGPYFDRQKWSASPRIEAVVRTALAEGQEEASAFLLGELERFQVRLQGLTAAAVAGTDEPQAPIALPKVDPQDTRLIANMPPEQALAQALSAEGQADRGRQLFTSQSCTACHTYADGQTPKGPHLVDIGKRYKRAELFESILKPSAKIAQGFDTYTFVTDSGRVLTGFVVGESADTVRIREATGLARDIPIAEIEQRVRQPLSMMPEGLIHNLTPAQLADLVAYLESLK
ncbi:MAG: discoidin domain-containing protein [Pirellulaceae bacterium]|nr:discoidin domain-containing protein [Pirellulaceae bacterium]